jgi:hypothetical protein
VVKAEGRELLERVNRATVEEFNRLENAPETQRLMGELEWLKTVTPTDFCKEIDRRHLPRELLGKNFQGIDVGTEPALPATITEELLNSDCPLPASPRRED